VASGDPDSTFSSDLPSSAKVGLGIGVGIGIPLLAAVAVIAFILFRRSSKRGTNAFHSMASGQDARDTALSRRRNCGLIHPRPKICELDGEIPAYEMS